MHIMIEKTKGKFKKLNIKDISLEDKETYNLLSSARTVGVFPTGINWNERFDQKNATQSV